MQESTKQKIVDALSSYPPGLRQGPATATDVEALEAEAGPVPEEFKWFLLHCGGGVVGREHIDGIDESLESQRKYRREVGPEGWSMRDVFIIGWDGGGNPIAIDRRTGQIKVEDHTFGGVHVEAESLEKYLLDLLFPSRR